MSCCWIGYLHISNEAGQVSDSIFNIAFITCTHSQSRGPNPRMEFILFVLSLESLRKLLMDLRVVCLCIGNDRFRFHKSWAAAISFSFDSLVHCQRYPNDTPVTFYGLFVLKYENCEYLNDIESQRHLITFAEFLSAVRCHDVVDQPHFWNL